VDFDVVHPIILGDFVDIWERFGLFVELGPPKGELGPPRGHAPPTAADRDDVDRQLFLHLAD
jgi:hypothetical protein